MIVLLFPLGIVLFIVAASALDESDESIALDLLIFVACLGGILYRKHKREQDEE